MLSGVVLPSISVCGWRTVRVRVTFVFGVTVSNMILWISKPLHELRLVKTLIYFSSESFG